MFDFYFQTLLQRGQTERERFDNTLQENKENGINCYEALMMMQKTCVSGTNTSQVFSNNSKAIKISRNSFPYHLNLSVFSDKETEYTNCTIFIVILIK